MGMEALDIGQVRRLDANGRSIRYAEKGSGWRYATLLDKEPETIAWIDGFRPGDTLWDIGANVGIYSVYAGVHGIRTLAFEPHFANYHQLCINIGLNGLQDAVTPLCLAFAEARGIAHMNLASVDFGTSMSAFGDALDFRGRPFAPAFRQGMVGYDIDGFVADFGMAVPSHLKIDVDGIELPIVRGARRTLADPALRSVSIELVESDAAQVEAVTDHLAEAGLSFVHKKQNIAFATSDTRDVLNFLFQREAAGTSVMVEPRADWRNTAAERLAARIADAPVDEVPSPNLYLEEALPPELYRELLYRLPDDAALDPIKHPDAVAPDGRVTRYLLDLTPATLGRIEVADQAFWADMIKVLTNPVLTQAVMQRFAPALAERFGATLPDIVAVPVFYRDLAGYRIGIHPDAPYKVATLQLYLPADATQAHLGTSFHVREGNQFTLHKTNAFRPNSGYAFVRTDESWHSVDELGPGEAPRNTIAITYYLRGQEYRAPARPEDQSAEEAAAEALRALAASISGPAELAAFLPPGSTAVMLGETSGEMVEAALTLSDVAWAHAVDGWAGVDGDAAYAAVIARLAVGRARCGTIRLAPARALDLFEEASLDFVHLDRSVPADLAAAWFAKVAPGATLAATGHDGAAFAGAHRLPVFTCADNETWFAVRP